MPLTVPVRVCDCVQIAELGRLELADVSARDSACEALLFLILGSPAPTAAASADRVYSEPGFVPVDLSDRALSPAAAAAIVRVPPAAAPLLPLTRTPPSPLALLPTQSAGALPAMVQRYFDVTNRPSLQSLGEAAVRRARVAMAAVCVLLLAASRSDAGTDAAGPPSRPTRTCTRFSTGCAIALCVRAGTTVRPHVCRCAPTNPAAVVCANGFDLLRHTLALVSLAADTDVVAPVRLPLLIAVAVLRVLLAVRSREGGHSPGSPRESPCSRPPRV